MQCHACPSCLDAEAVWLQGDARYAEAGNVVTHDLTQLKAHPVETLGEAHNRVWQYDVIAVDEGQFMPGILISSACPCPIQTSQHFLFEDSICN